MQLTKEILIADKALLEDKVKELQGQVSYIDGLIKFIDAPEPIPTPEPLAEPQETEGELIDG